MGTELVKLIELISRSKPTLKCDYSVSQIAIFGSYAKERQKKLVI